MKSLTDSFNSACEGRRWLGEEFNCKVCESSLVLVWQVEGLSSASALSPLEEWRVGI